MAKTRCGRRRCNTIATWGSSPPHTERSIEAPVGTPFRRGFVCTKEDGALTREASALREWGRGFCLCAYVALFRIDDVQAYWPSKTAIWMLRLFLAPTPFEGWGEHSYDGTYQRQLLAVLIVSVGALALTLWVALLMLFADELLGPLDHSRFPVRACLIPFAWRSICQ